MGDRIPEFSEIVGDEGEFFKDYFRKMTMYRPQGASGDMRQLLSIADMDAIIHQEGLRSPLIRMLGNGVPAAGESLTSKLSLRRSDKSIDDALDPEKIYSHFRAGKTLIHSGLNHTRPNIRALGRMMTQKFAEKSEVVAFLSPAGHQGGPIHSDPTDVYIIHLEGTKKWQVWPTPQVRRTGDASSYQASELPEPILDVSLRPGDVLYIPHNTPHMAMAEETVSLHLTVIAGPRMWSQLLLPIIQEILHDSPEFWATPYLDDSGDHGKELGDKLEELIERLRKVDVDDELRRAQENGRAYRGVRQGDGFQQMASADAVEADTTLMTVEGATTFHEAMDGESRVIVLGNTLQMPDAVVTALKSARSRGPFAAGEFLAGEHARESLSTAKRLLQLGALEIATGSGS
jgi:ribosomal protein L16 Arg81 hydroxylase